MIPIETTIEAFLAPFVAARSLVPSVFMTAPLVTRQRITSGDVLASTQRQRLLALIEACPGLPVGELMARLDLPSGTLYHHLSALERAELIVTHAVGRRRLVYVTSHARVVEHNPAGLSLLHGRTTRRVARAILESPNRGISSVMSAIGAGRRVAYYHVQRLLEAGLIQTGGRARRRALVPAPHLEAALASVSPEDELED